MGIHSPLQNVKSLPLGSCDVNLLELVNSYCTVIADGEYEDPIMITKIEDRRGRTIYEAKHDRKQAIPYRSAFFMRKMLEAGLRESGGTSMALWQYIHPVLQYSEFGGKTGTSNNHSDAWFVGVTPKMVAGAWVGGEFRSIHFRTGQLGQGSRTALPVFGYFIQSLLKDDKFPQYREKFAKPKEPIREDEWMCKGVLAIHPDSLRNDSIRRDTIASPQQ
jgi:penicillin-binding protein 1A